jgi:SnoaL-like domain
MSADEGSPSPAWGHATGVLDLSANENVRGDLLPDRVALIDRMYRYAWSFDERQLEMLADCFTVDATWEANFMGTSSIGPFIGHAEVVTFMSSFWPNQMDQRRHMIMNPLIEDQGEEEATVLTYHLLVSTTVASGVVPVTTGFYRVRMAKSPDGIWRIKHLVAGYDVPF